MKKQELFIRWWWNSVPHSNWVVGVCVCSKWWLMAFGIVFLVRLHGRIVALFWCAWMEWVVMAYWLVTSSNYTYFTLVRTTLICWVVTKIGIGSSSFPWPMHFSPISVPFPWTFQKHVEYVVIKDSCCFIFTRSRPPPANQASKDVRFFGIEWLDRRETRNWKTLCLDDVQNAWFYYTVCEIGIRIVKC